MFDTNADRDRVATLAEYDLTDPRPDPALDAIVRDTAELADAPIAMVSIIDDRRQYFRAKLGVEHDGDPIEDSICAHAIRGEDVLVVNDARADHRFRDMAGVRGGPGIRFYAGAPLTLGGVRVGTLCVIDVEPRAGLDAPDRSLLQTMARRTVAALERRRQGRTEPSTDPRHDVQCLSEALGLLEQAVAALDEAGATGPLAQLTQTIAMVDDLHARAIARG